MDISFDIQDDIAVALNETPQELTQNMRFWAALAWYRKGKLSLGKAASLAGYPKLDFIEKMQLEKEPIFHFDSNTMDEIMEDAAKLP